MSEQTIEVIISPDGNVQIHVQGIPGASCLSETEALLQRLGGQVIQQGLTMEAYEAPAPEQQYTQEKYHA